MTDEKNENSKRSSKGEELRKYAKKAAEGLFDSSSSSEFNERELASGDAGLLEKSDAELFPDEIEEYTDKGKKPRIVVNNDSKRR